MLTMAILLSKNSVVLKTEDISFVSLKTSNTDGFEIKTFVNLPPKIIIHFTDSEWNGNRFGPDESNIIWETGNDTIKAKSVITFTNLNTIPSVSIGNIYGSMRISKEKDAVFAYIGSERLPVKILAACANDQAGFGTLVNTHLTKDITAILFQ